MLLLVCIWQAPLIVAHANIVQDNLPLSDHSTRSLFVGDLAITPSAGRIEDSFYDVVGVGFSSDSRYVGVCCFYNTSDYYSEFARIRIYTNNSLSLVANYTLSFNAMSYRAIAWNPVQVNGDYFIAVTGFKFDTPNHNYISVCRFDGQSLQLLTNAQVEIPLPVDHFFCVASWSPDGRYLAVMLEDCCKLYAFDGATLSLVSTIQIAPSTPVSWSCDGKFIGLIGNGQALIYSISDADLLLVSSTNVGVDAQWLVFNPVAHNLVVAGLTDNIVSLSAYSYTATGSISQVASVSGGLSVSSLKSVVWSPDGNFILAGENAINVYAFDGATLTNLTSSRFVPNTFTDPLHWSTYGGGDVAWSPDMTSIAAGTTVFESIPYNVNGISNSPIILYSTGFLSLPSYAEALAKAPIGLTNIVTSTVDQFWGIRGGDLMFSSTEAGISRMRGAWVRAQCQGALTSGNITDLMISTDGNFYALDLLGKAYVSDSVIVDAQVRINWQVLSRGQGGAPILTKLYQAPYGIMGSDQDNIFYRYRPSSGWLRIG